jgi:hypothetical protein
MMDSPWPRLSHNQPVSIITACHGSGILSVAILQVLGKLNLQTWLGKSFAAFGAMFDYLSRQGRFIDDAET